MTTQQILTGGLVCWLLLTLARCAIDDIRLARLARQIKKGGFL